MKSVSSSSPAHVPGGSYTFGGEVSLSGEAVQSTSGEELSDLPFGAPDPDSVRRMVKPDDVHDGKDNIELGARTVSALNDGAVASQYTFLDLLKREKEKRDKDLKSFFRGGECPEGLHWQEKPQFRCDSEFIKLRAEEYAKPAGKILFRGRPYALVGLPGSYCKIKVASPEELVKVTRLQADFLDSLGSDAQNWKEKAVKARDELLRAIPSSDDFYVSVIDLCDFYVDDASYILDEADYVEFTHGIIEGSSDNFFHQVVSRLRAGEDKVRLQLEYAKHKMIEISYGPPGDDDGFFASWMRVIDLLIQGDYEAALECKHQLFVKYDEPR